MGHGRIDTSTAASKRLQSSEDTDSSEDQDDPESQEVDLGNVDFAGNLMLKTFDGTAWSKPTPLFDINAGQHLG